MAAKANERAKITKARRAEFYPSYDFDSERPGDFIRRAADFFEEIEKKGKRVLLFEGSDDFVNIYYADDVSYIAD